CQFWMRGLNDTYKLTTKTDNFILRVYRKGWRTNAAIAFEVDALNYLHAQGGKVSRPVERKAGGYITDIMAPEGHRQAILTQYAQGETLSYDDPANARLFGQAAADIHVRSADFQTTYQRHKLDLNHLLFNPLAILKDRLSAYPQEIEFFTDCAKQLSDRVNAISDQLETGFCHGDFHGLNAHAHQGEVTHFDFDCCGFGWRIYDLATFKWIARKNKKEAEWWPPFLEGYQSVRPIPALDLDALDAFIAIREIWLMAIHLNSPPVFPSQWLNDKYVKRGVEFVKASVSQLMGDDD
ncbi:MAG: phosphotransferase enzyme family protein, partial [Candidatus Promineifilaceae bacterium]